MSRSASSSPGSGSSRRSASGTEETWQGLAARARAGIGPITQLRSHRLRHALRGRGEGLRSDRAGSTTREAKTRRPLHPVRDRRRRAGDGGRGPARSSGADRRAGRLLTSAPASAASRRSRSTARRCGEKGPRHGISPFFVPRSSSTWRPGSSRSATAPRGRTCRHVSACSTGAHAIGEAFRRHPARRRRRDDLRAAPRRPITPLGVGGFNAMRALSTRNESPQQASPAVRHRPRRLRHRRGRGHRRARGAGARQEARRARSTPSCRLRRQRRRAPHHRAGRRKARAPSAACGWRSRTRGLTPEDIGYINAHGTSTRMNDANETHGDQEGLRRRTRAS